MCERRRAEYEEELCPTKEKKRQHQPLDAVFKKHQVVLHRTDAQQPPHIKEEEEEVWITQEEECLLGQEEADLSKFPLTVVSVKTEEHEDKPPESSQLHHSPNVCEEHLLPEQQEWSCKMEEEEPQPSHFKVVDTALQTPHFKEEEEEHRISQEGELTVFSVVVKSEDDEVKVESEEKREAELPSSSTEADGDHCGGSQADKLLAPLSDSEDTTSHSPDTDDEDSKDDKTCHTDNTHLTCSYCDKTFNYLCRLRTHMRIHTGEKPFTCSVCGKGFARKDVLKEHMRTHTGEKSFTCSICGKGFVTSTHLKVHTRMHTKETPFSCSMCGKGYVTSTNLKVHMRRHTRENTFICSVCGKDFLQNHDLKRHMRTHTGEKVWCCSVCGEGFSYKYQCKKHKCAGEDSSGK
ncbi:oocyte zinc finger protein XlCOF8.4-like [Nerophis ophidion]|uniref:oocyte zinc finger protein XlCOF8.4-like n=1 Tax=Nerophis ophidion TaxID=159077 RepID=UPI002ADF1DF9|nr:oocyte zinc finger protein XlCOF8.4-like [Nerophis ophidion]